MLYICVKTEFLLVNFVKFHRREVSRMFIDLWQCLILPVTPQWGSADAEIKVPLNENTELKGSPFKTWSRSVHCHACYAYYQEFLPC